MCGIAGIISLNGRPVEDGASQVNKMLKALSHRGPDDEGIYLNNQNTVVLGNNRLSITDPENHFPLPMISPNTGQVVAFNGELYDYEKQRSLLDGGGYEFKTRSDTEVLLYLLEKYGVQHLDQVDGMWAFAHYIPKQNKVVLSRDILGERHLFFTICDQKFYFASEAAALRSVLPSDHFQLNEQQVVNALRYHVAEPGSGLHSTIRRLKAGEFVEIIVGQPELKSSALKLNPENWLDFFAADPTETVIMDKLSELIFDSVRNRIPVDVEFFSTLSGGVDSTLVAYFSSQHKKGINTLFLDSRTGLEKADASEMNELETSQFTSKIIGSNHNVLPVNQSHAESDLLRCRMHSDSGCLDQGIASFAQLSRTVKSLDSKVIFFSDGPDELCGGYRLDRALHERNVWHKQHLLLSYLVKLLSQHRTGRRVLRRGLGWNSKIVMPFECGEEFAFPVFHEMFGPDFLQRFVSLELLGRSNGLFGSIPKCYGYLTGKLDFSQKQALSYASYSIPDYTNLRLDLGMMSNSVEARSPFLAKALVEFMIAMPEKCRFQKGYSKYILRKLVERHIGPDVAWRKKHGFSLPISKRKQVSQNLKLTDSLDNSAVFENSAFTLPRAEASNLKRFGGKLNWPVFLLNYQVEGGAVSGSASEVRS
ncbi:MAG: asparagine synthase (glutamine-hydrolyzing) [Rhizobiaceae bacterium]